MGVYVSRADCTDPAVSVSEEHCARADTLIEADLAALGADPDELTLPVPVLTLLGSYYATASACMERSRGEDTALLSKAAMYGDQAKALAKKLTRPGLGLAVAESTETGAAYCRVRRG